MRGYLKATAGFAVVALAIAPGVAKAATAQQIGVQHAAASRSVQAASSNGKQPLGVVPHRGAGAPGAAAPTGGRPAPGYDEPPITGPLTYHSGRVMHSSTV